MSGPGASGVLPPDQRAEAWSATAQAYDSFSQPVTLPFAEDAARLVRIGPGTRVLDVAAGTGHFTFAAARHGATVLATDFAPAMLEVLDGRALRELSRVLVPGGRAVIAAWAPPPRGDMSRLLGGALAKVLPAAPTPAGPPHWAKLGDADAFRERLFANGFSHAHVVELRHVWVLDRIEELTERMPTATPCGVALNASLQPEQRIALATAIGDDLRARQGAGPYAITHEALVAVGTK